ncbi:MAG: hypothetical protein IH595_13130, partial [Bacteroidales bacterium]|nr:hypothetical protein [Bacteroidales bacterium]
MNTFLISRHNFLIGFIISVLVMAVILPFVKVGGKYKLTTLTDISKSSNYIFIYKDLWKDGNSEQIRVMRNIDGQSSFLILKNGRALYQWSSHGKIVKNDFLCTEDLNHDGLDEIYVFTHSHDSIFLNGLDLKTKITAFKPIFITRFNYYDGKIDVEVHNPQFKDIYHDGNKELIFSVFATYSKSPRKIFEVNIKDRKVISSPTAGTSARDFLSVCDINQDGKDEIMGEVPALQNFPKEFTHSDSYLWLMVYNSNLKYLFEPKKLGNYYGFVFTYPLVTKAQNFIAIFCNHTGISDSSFLAIANYQGKILRYKNIKIPKVEDPYFFKVLPEGKKSSMVLYRGDGFVEYFSKFLKLTGTYQSVPFSGNFNTFDLDGDGQKEEIYFGSGTDDLVVSRYNFKDPTVIKIPGINAIGYFSEKWENHKPEALCLSLPNRYYEFSYKKNPVYTFRFLIYGGIFIMLFFFFNLIGYYYQRLLKIRYSAEKRIQENQLRSIEMQLNPHFILNT